MTSIIASALFTLGLLLVLLKAEISLHTPPDRSLQHDIAARPILGCL